ncbi:methyltransferase domain-containing protein [Spirulina sp. CS-785/01]|uniref:class I SAM-dependent methyltransferase n=1 Tax=Spirulina sp. CS-785/01 TaxID=3021716 RepID=UPI00233038A4|nr:class I SAM-dependent methyltransferase [Spirulina sp. CS-785/01]MDB9315739.1 methyltransferase domain-containing protein [Spirulina sp. CS-785/01]
MGKGQDTLWEQFLKPIVRTWIDEEKLQRFAESVDWERECDRIANPQLVYPAYYKQNFHGIPGGYLTPEAAVSYDPITQYFLPPNEDWVRQAALAPIGGVPRRILDLGCGTGSTTLRLKQAFPHAEVIGLDLSPYMLFMGEYKAQQQNMKITWRHAKAEATGFPDASFDVVTAALLFHEIPVSIAPHILAEAFRLLTPGGQLVILDGHQTTLHQMTWLTEIFEEPYIQEYASGKLEKWLEEAQFVNVQTNDFWWIHQISSGRKPIPGQSVNPQNADIPWHFKPVF